MSNYNPDYISLFSNSNFRKKVIERKGVSRNQLLAYRDFQDNFQQRIANVEHQFQMPIEQELTKSRLVNLYSAHIKEKFTVKQFSEKTGISPNTSRREIQSAIRRGIIEKLPREHAKELQEYKYK